MRSAAAPTAGSEHAADAPLSVHDLTVAYHRKPVLWDVDLDIPDGALVGVVGPNRGGQSTRL
jgi:manganese/zinc/iron transport system ATP- binding protein